MDHKMKVAIGLVLIICAFALFLAVPYFMDQKSKGTQDQMDALQVELANLVAEKSKAELSASEQEKTARGPIALADVLARADIIYGEAELKRKDGVLWIDRKTSQGLVTLGAVNGLAKGDTLAVYEEKRQADGSLFDEKVDEVTVRDVYDLISYVEPATKSWDDFTRDYYRVSVRFANP